MCEIEAAGDFFERHRLGSKCNGGVDGTGTEPFAGCRDEAKN